MFVLHKISEDSSKGPVMSSVKASLDNSSVYVFSGPRGRTDGPVQLSSILTVSVCFVHLKTGVGKR